MSLSRKDIEEIMQLLEASCFDRLNLEMDGVKLELVREGGARPSTGSGRAEKAPPPSQTSSPPEPAEAPGQPSPSPAGREGLAEVKSPLLGVFYRAPKPGEPPFVEVGDRVSEDTVIGIVEVMKLMNSARAGIVGEVVEIVAINGEMVEHGEVLMLVRPD